MKNCGLFETRNQIKWLKWQEAAENMNFWKSYFCKLVEDRDFEWVKPWLCPILCDPKEDESLWQEISMFIQLIAYLASNLYGCLKRNIFLIHLT